MAVSSRTYARQRDLSKLFIALAVLAAVVAIAPIAAAVLGYGSRAVAPKTAFATAPSGDYAVIGRSEAGADVISVASAANPTSVTEIARVPHLEGFASSGAVSPNGKLLALVTVDSGSASHPMASLKVVSLESGIVKQVAADVLPRQVPVWDPAGGHIVVVSNPGSDTAAGESTVLRVKTDGSDAATLATFTRVLGVYPVGFRGDALAMVVIDGRGSTLRVGDKDEGLISPYITRDWNLSPDGGELAFIETQTADGVQYVARTFSLAGSSDMQAQSAGAAVSALGTAWNPRTGAPVFGVEPETPGTPGVTVQSLQAGGAGAGQPGFDVPMGFSNDGDHLFVTRWSGPSFETPGQPVLQIVSASGRSSFENYSRFYGWAAR